MKHTETSDFDVKQGWEPILWKTIFDNDTDTQSFFYFRLSADNAEKNIGIAMNDDFAMKFLKYPGKKLHVILCSFLHVLLHRFFICM